LPSLLISRLNEPPAQGRAENAINGGDAEAFAMAKVILACRGEGQWGSRQDDNSKIDLMFATDHPWHKGERMLILCQVKSGPSYGSILQEGGGFKLMGSAKAAAKKSSHDICIIWVDRDNDRAFWAYIHPDSKSDVQGYGSNHEINPAMIFDLARCMAGRGAAGGEGGRGVTLPDGADDIPQRRAFALRSYRQARFVESPVLGRIELTRLGWRHMFRKTRSAQNKNASLNLIPRLPSILQERPSVVAITSTQFHQRGNFDHRICEYLLKYEQINIRRRQEPNQRKITAHIRVIEEVRYPRDWEKKAMLSQLVDRRVVLKSAYYKEQ